MSCFFRAPIALILVLIVTFEGWSWVATSKLVAADHTTFSLNQPALPNAIRVSTDLIFGGRPDGEAGFATLETLNVRTVVSVDGERPAIEQARKHEMRYVHLPVGYDGITTERCRQLAQVVNRLPGPVYIHCHHGQHRAPAAAAVALIAAGKLNVAQGQEFLSAAGTGAEYKGLWQAVAMSRPLVDNSDPDDLPELPEVIKPEAMTEMMTRLQATMERLEAASVQQNAAGSLRHADDAVLLRERFAELLRLPEVRTQPTAFRNLMKESQIQSALLAKLLQGEDRAAPYGTETVPNLLVTIRRGCRKCHTQFRD